MSFNQIWKFKKKEFVGLIDFKSTDKANQKTEIGYWLSEKHLKLAIITKCVEILYVKMDYLLG